MIAVVRTAALHRLPVHIKVDHLVQADRTQARLLGEDERVHDSQPHHEKILFDVEVDWVGDSTIAFDARIEAVYNISPIVNMLNGYFHEREPLKSPLESVLDLIVSKATVDARVIAVRARAERPNIMLNDSVWVAVAWSRVQGPVEPFPVI